jgi:serine/threonine-protein kinase
MPSARLSQLAGQTLGSYHLVELVGRGRLAVVYKARQPVLRRHVALKLLPPDLTAAADFRARFFHAAETAAALSHPNILPVYDFGQDGDVCFLAMPLNRGGTLRDWLAEPRPLDQAMEVYSGLLGALAYAHDRQPAVGHGAV